MEILVQIQNLKGLHARAAASFVKKASEFEAQITVQKDENIVSGRSIMGLMMLAASKGSKILITAEGKDEQEAIMALEELINDRFNEE
jgi:phosphocarrier protein